MLEELLKGYKNSPSKLVKHTWLLCLFFVFVDFLISIGVAAKNDNVIGGSSSAAFAALWSFFVALLFSYGGSHLVFIGNGSALMVGFVIGASFMLSQLFFVLMCIFFTYGSTAKTDHIDTEKADNAMGVFAFFNIIVFALWGVVLAYNRSLYIQSSGSSDANRTLKDVEEGPVAVQSPLSTSPDTSLVSAPALPNLSHTNTDMNTSHVSTDTTVIDSATSVPMHPIEQSVLESTDHSQLASQAQASSHTPTKEESVGKEELKRVAEAAQSPKDHEADAPAETITRQEGASSMDSVKLDDPETKG